MCDMGRGSFVKIAEDKTQGERRWEGMVSHMVDSNI